MFKHDRTSSTGEAIVDLDDLCRVVYSLVFVTQMVKCCNGKEVGEGLGYRYFAGVDKLSTPLRGRLVTRRKVVGHGGGDAESPEVELPTERCSFSGGRLML